MTLRALGTFVRENLWNCRWFLNESGPPMATFSLQIDAKSAFQNED